MSKKLRKLVDNKNKTTEENLLKFYKIEPTLDKKGWKVSVIDRTLSEYPDLPNKFQGLPIVDLEGAFAGCSNLKMPPKLPKEVKNLSYAFAQCTSLHTLPRISQTQNNINVEGMVSDCLGLIPPKNQPVTDKTKLIVANISEAGVIDDIREITVGEIKDQFPSNVLIDVETISEILNAPTTTGVVEVGTATTTIDNCFSYDTTLFIIGSESFSGGQNMSNLTSLNIDPFQLINQNKVDSQTFGLLCLCNQISVAFGSKKALPAFLTSDENTNFKLTGLANFEYTVADQSLETTNRIR